MNARLAEAILVGCLAAISCGAGGDGLEVDQPEPWEVTRVIDGDTIVVAGAGTVRMLGIDAPESVHPRLPVQPCGLDASVFLHQIVYRRRVRLEVSPAASRDRWGRLLAVVWRDTASGPIDVNLRMVRQGLARVETRWYFQREKEYLVVQEQARQARRGIWNERPCQ